ncbi:alpha,alpha-trehalase TreA [Pseudomonas japonica]|uniref:alpha,alpha-trehalase TreA n=1 Tax=Pseudomonas japonica TaxID=256466 RepID=UPI0015E47362|nr:alpha,alpha-trehalase TreA [Pseudomonas japonica]MBA1288502.1 alpha,alpha-trehalase TreA [Pseudomonas japonica]
MTSFPRATTLAVSITLAAIYGCSTAEQQPVTPQWTWQAVSASREIPPDRAYPELFLAVQQSNLFTDQKHFVDALPRKAPADIRAAYLAQKDQPGFDLKAFVTANFEESGTADVQPPKPGADLPTHINDLWPVLTRNYQQVPAYSSLLPLPRSFVVPGGRFREMYYWDSYFTMLGLAESGRTAQVRDMVDNFAYLIDTYGHIPNGNRTYYLSRSQPPFFAYMVDLLARLEGDSAYQRYLPQLQKEYAYWMEGAQTLKPGEATAHVVKLADGSVLNRYWDASDAPRQESWAEDRATAAQAPDRPAAEVYRDLRAGAESGWDYSSRWLGDGKSMATIRTTAIVPVDLNSLMFHLEQTIAKACQQSSQPACTARYTQWAQARQKAVEQHLWNPAGFYADYDWQKQALSDRISAASLYPLYAGLATQAHAEQTAASVNQQLLRPGGLATTTQNSGQQWDAPNGWAPLQLIAVQGLRGYGQDALAETIGRRFLEQVQNLYGREAKLVEKYDIEGGQGGGGGEYALQDGFGWTNGVTLELLKLYGKPAQ